MTIWIQSPGAFHRTRLPSFAVPRCGMAVARMTARMTANKSERRCAMSFLNILRAWKDPEYRRSLGAAERALLPDHPAGAIELTDAEMGASLGACPSDGGYTCGYSCDLTCGGPGWCNSVDWCPLPP